MNEKLPDIKSRRGRYPRPDHTERDRQICDAIAAGDTLEQAAKPWGISPMMASKIYRRARDAQQKQESSEC